MRLLWRLSEFYGALRLNSRFISEFWLKIEDFRAKMAIFSPLYSQNMDPKNGPFHPSKTLYPSPLAPTNLQKRPIFREKIFVDLPEAPILNI